MSDVKVTLRFGGKSGRLVKLKTSLQHVVVRTLTQPTTRTVKDMLRAASRSALLPFQSRVRFPEHRVDILDMAAPDEAARDNARAVLKTDPEVQFAGRALVSDVPGASTPIVYTENLFVKLDPAVKASAAKAWLTAHGLTIKRQIPYIDRGYFVEARSGIGLDVFPLAEEILAEDAVQFCHPEIIRQRCTRAAFPRQWHLQKVRIDSRPVDAHASVVAAWKKATGKGMVIAVIDDGVDVDHEEFATAGKIVHPRDLTDNDDDPRPGNRDNHGTACAGVACASGKKGASGVAPDARLMPLRLNAELGSQSEGDAFAWAADHGADVISCSWGPNDGEWFNPDDPQHHVFEALPDSTRLAIDYAVTKGRHGKGSVVLFAAGNGNESVDNDGYASYPGVIAVAACNDRSMRSIYSDMGRALWCAFPSNDFEFEEANHPAPITSGIWTTDRSGKVGYNPGSSTKGGDRAGHYTNSFGGTSSACPGAAGVVALVLSANPALTPTDVRTILKATADKIDLAGGEYDDEGHSPKYGFGRINAAAAVSAAIALKEPPAPRTPAGPRARAGTAKKKGAKKTAAKRGIRGRSR
jgi:subtilisin family serine protease